MSSSHCSNSGYKLEKLDSNAWVSDGNGPAAKRGFFICGPQKLKPGCADRIRFCSVCFSLKFDAETNFSREKFK